MQNKSILIAILCSLLWVFFQNSLFAQILIPPDELQYPPLKFQMLKADRVELPNGITMFFLEDRELPLVHMNFLFRTGTVNDPAGKEGVAELTTYLMRTGGCKKFTSEQIDQRLDQLAASPSFSISLDSASIRTTFFKSDLDTGMELLSEMIIHPVFEEKKFDIAVALKKEGLRRIMDDPQRLAFREFNRLLYPDDSRGRYMTSASLRQITRDDLAGFHKAHFFAGNMMIAISGDLSREEAVHLVTKHFGRWQQMGPVPEMPGPPAKLTGGFFLMRKKLTQSTLVSGEFTVGKKDPDYYAFLLLDFILGSGGFPSHIFSAVRNNEGLAYSAGSFYRARPEYGVFGTYAFTKTETTYQALTLMQSILKKAAEGSITNEELVWAKNSIRNGFIFSFDHPASIASQQMQIAFEKLPDDYLMQYLKNIDAVTRNDLKRVAMKYLQEQKRITLILGDTSNFGSPPNYLGEPVYITPQE